MLDKSASSKVDFIVPSVFPSGTETLQVTPKLTWRRKVKRERSMMNMRRRREVRDYMGNVGLGYLKTKISHSVAITRIKVSSLCHLQLL